MAKFTLNSTTPAVKEYHDGAVIPTGLYRDESGDLMLVGREGWDIAVFFVNEGSDDVYTLEPVDSSFIDFPLRPAPAGTSLTITQE